MKLKLYQVDAFTDKLFGGNPAAVCPLEKWLPDEFLQKIAMENNLAETAFYIKHNDSYLIRWFTPETEVDLCGHATLATAFVLFNSEGHTGDTIVFHSMRSGELKVSRQGEILTLNFPADDFSKIDITQEIIAPFDKQPIEAYLGKTDYMLVFENEEQIKALKPDMGRIKLLPVRGVIVTARSAEVDFISRFFAPQSGIDEDPVTGSAHTTLCPYWTKVLGKTELSAIQWSPRKGYLSCKQINERVEISGKCKAYLRGEIHIV